MLTAVCVHPLTVLAKAEVLRATVRMVTQDHIPLRGVALRKKRRSRSW